MANTRGNVWIENKSGYSVIPTQNWAVDSTMANIKEGYPTKANVLPYVMPCESLDLTIGTDTRFFGIAQKDSTETSSADGTVECYVPLTGVVYGSIGTTTTNIDTAAEIAAYKGVRVVWTLSSSVFTIDENAADGATNALCVVGGDATLKALHYVIVNDASYLGWNA